ncbi:MAG: 50S ribosomal protein L11 methyltransferase [Candidatus Thiodiazotropha lotti]|uniref:Ribosomal protein L11 methyltransferase n=1 Tax=Candidatus Thiodiazotropha lotti TaxID=2792787 RepID=A0A9E4K4T9_9GAMM|nr:50S ribosomal protein L11 methyltransferase [Candidatus Thiodiazotropha lotti]ODC00052.1 ribosomal protein L11 methyltransferase [Candidatus Thiodiazotropha endoloripes]MCG7939039.1 50S ribosomal protein L11 methyltransferase [Candidatus Thiodiazotropha lotti]MCG8003654.1 50S ribosomal protein L11 methyltransferase [Candidatus Thiodiazotropha lotti]MCW4187275.1 50S ribosomal protein L11 methyltransferase [Candidatus Thiodiazotropha lotti]
MSWLQLSLDTSEEQAPILELVFENLGALSVTLGDAGDQPLLETPPASEQLWRHTRVTALFEGDQDQKLLQQALGQALSEALLNKLCWERIEDRIWERVWLEHFKPMSFGKRLWVCPAGEQISEPDGVVIQLDPGLAFGTGTHPTTALCLTWLDSQALTGKTVIDYGCGSGILAIAALKLGASSVIAIDHDPQALQASQDNAVKNGVADRLSTYLPDEAPADKADYLVANILAGPLIELAPQLIDRIKPNGQFALSGILAEQADELTQHYRPFASLDPVEQQEEWILISGVNYKNG